jgi:hypothetical protein
MDTISLNLNNLISLTLPADNPRFEIVRTQVGYYNREWDGGVLGNRFHNRVKPLYDILKNRPAGSTIVDIGAGNSIVDLALAALLPEKNFKFILVDGSNGSSFDRGEIKFPELQYNEDEYLIYNEWSFVEDAIRLNNLPRENFTFVHPSDFKECSADVIMSFASWGWHYPVDMYLPLVKAGLKERGYLAIYGLMNVDNAFDKLEAVFGEPVFFETIQFKEEAYTPNEAEKIKKQIDSGKFNRELFGANGIWKRTY